MAARVHTAVPGRNGVLASSAEHPSGRRRYRRAAQREPSGERPHSSVEVELRALLDALGSPAYVLDRRGRVRWLNAAGVELFGDRVGEHYLNVVAREDWPFSQAQFARKIVGDGPTLFDVVAVDRSGRRVTVRVSSAPLHVDDAIVGVFGVLVPLGRVDAPTGEGPPHSLTPRQLETLRLLADGLPTEEVAGRLGVAVETARNHIRAVLQALDVHSRLEAVMKGQEIGLLSRADLTQVGQAPADPPRDDTDRAAGHP